MVNKQHPWRLCNDTFRNIHFISNSKRLGKFLGANQVPALYLDQNLLSRYSHVNNQIGSGVEISVSLHRCLHHHLVDGSIKNSQIIRYLRVRGHPLHLPAFR